MKSFRTFLEASPPLTLEDVNETQVYCDLDGVLADFEGTSQKLVGKWERDLSPEQKRELSTSPGFWLSIPFMPSGRKLWSYIRHHDPFILTAYPEWDEENKVRKQKIEWVERYLPGVPRSKIKVVRRSEKKNFAMSEGGRFPNLLIDDYERNVKQWGQAGGIAVLHNASTVEKTIAKLKELGF